MLVNKIVIAALIFSHYLFVPALCTDKRVDTFRQAAGIDQIDKIIV